MFLHLLVSHIGQVGPVCRLGRVLGVDVEVGEQHRLGEGGLVVDPAAAVPVSAGTCEVKVIHQEEVRTNFTCFEEKRTVYFVFFCPKDASQILRHF